MSFVRIAASAAIFSLLSVGIAIAKPVTTTGDTNLRKSPGTYGEVITLIPKGTTVEVGKCTDGWCEVSLNGQDGFSIAQNLGMAPARRAPRGPMVVGDGYGPPPAYGPRGPYVVGPPVYYGYRPYPYYPYPYYGGWGYRGWGWRW